MSTSRQLSKARVIGYISHLSSAYYYIDYLLRWIAYINYTPLSANLQVWRQEVCR